MTFQRDYPHLEFKRKWKLSDRAYIALGQSIALIRAISNTPILPKYYEELMKVALRKGAQSTTAIEGNTLNDEDIAQLLAGKKLPESLEYQGTEVTNILNAFNKILQDTVVGNMDHLVTPSVLLDFHRMVGQDLGEHFAAIPGRFRNSDVTVGTYRCPDYRDVPELIDCYCGFLREEFKYEDGQQKFSDVFIEAIVAHVYLEWIHPFGDGNGRTGRLVEFYILSRGGNPDITLHILSNHYNLTRPEYYRQIDKAYQKRDLSEFIEYALIGFRDGLQQTLDRIQDSQKLITWQKYIYEKLATADMGHREVFKRKRRLALEIPLEIEFFISEIPKLNVTLAGLYSSIPERTLRRDVEELEKLDILKKIGMKYKANTDALSLMIAKRKGNLI